MKTLGKLAIVTGLLMGLGTEPSLAQAASIADTPLPTLPGATASINHVYSVPGVVNNNHVTAAFHCVSKEKAGGKNIRWGVEVFDNGTIENDVSAGEGVLTLSPGHSAHISLDYALSLDFEESLGDPNVSAGAARILADSNNILCSAFLVDPNNAPPNFVAPLPIIKKTNQKGQ